MASSHWLRRGQTLGALPQRAKLARRRRLHDQSSRQGQRRGVGTISEEQLQFLADLLEEEFSEDNDYYIDASLLQLFQQRGADDDLLTLLKTALGDREGVELQWFRT